MSSTTSCRSSFPLKLRAMLEESYEQGLNHVVSWEMNGAAFKVHDPYKLTFILKKHFNSTKYKSFQRQLNLYGFTRISRGPNKGCYQHERFRRDDTAACQSISRKKVGERNEEPVIDLAPTWLPASMVIEPNPILEEHRHRQECRLSLSAFESYFQERVVSSDEVSSTDSLKNTRGYVKREKAPDSEDYALERMLDNMLKPRPFQTQTSEQQWYRQPAEEQKKKYQRTATFPDKLHDILNHCESKGLNKIASWEMDGRAFRVHDTDIFTKEVMPLFFKQTKYASLLRQLNLYGFSRVPKGLMKGCYYHALFIRGGRDLSKGMLRRIRDDVADLPSEQLLNSELRRPSSAFATKAQRKAQQDVCRLETDHEGKQTEGNSVYPSVPSRASIKSEESSPLSVPSWSSRYIPIAPFLPAGRALETSVTLEQMEQRFANALEG